ncbi:DUF7793 family protein [Specibacter sp. RAF43]|uniref:DUF7793 family protein n=1 Tax=Specibacter sp. RAF43 TaxID=3233057 RepID=UPI003F994BDD
MLAEEPAASQQGEDATEAPAVFTSDGGIKVWIEAPGILRVKLPHNAVIAGRHAESAADLIRTLADGHRYPTLLDLSGVLSVSRKARNVYGHPQAVAAYALLGNGPVDRVLAHFFLGAGPLEMPVQYFVCEAEALAWLGTHAENH